MKFRMLLNIQGTTQRRRKKSWMLYIKVSDLCSQKWPPVSPSLLQQLSQHLSQQSTSLLHSLIHYHRTLQTRQTWEGTEQQYQSSQQFPCPSTLHHRCWCCLITLCLWCHQISSLILKFHSRHPQVTNPVVHTTTTKENKKKKYLVSGRENISGLGISELMVRKWRNQQHVLFSGELKMTAKHDSMGCYRPKDPEVDQQLVEWFSDQRSQGKNCSLKITLITALFTLPPQVVYVFWSLIALFLYFQVSQ